MNKKVLATLEYDAVKAQLRPYLSTAAGENELRNLLPTADANEMQAWLAETSDAAKVLRWQGELIFLSWLMLSHTCNVYVSMQR